MKLREILPLEEAPLPDDWDKDIFNDQIPFKTRIEYAKARAQQIGTGSSRTAFKIPYQGRPTILKVAKNRKGAAQNELESARLDDYMLNNLKLTIPVIDYDERSAYPTWIHMEYADKVRERDFVNETGVSLREALQYAAEQAGNVDQYRMFKMMMPVREEQVKKHSQFLDRLIEYFGLYNPDQSEVMDMAVSSNWGMFRNHLVMVDLGIDDSIFHSHYWN